MTPDSSQASVSAALSLKDYIPVCRGKPYPTLCCGNVRDVDKTERANAAPSAEAPQLLFDGLVEAPPEFQKEHLLHEVGIRPCAAP